MAVGTTKSSAQQNAEPAMQVADWMREMTEQNLDQSRIMWEGFLTTARKAYEGLDQQLSETRRRSMSFAQETLSNGFDFAHKVVHAKGVGDLLHLESEFIGRQALVIAEQSKELGKNAMRGVQEVGSQVVGRMTSQGVAEASRRGTQAA